MEYIMSRRMYNMIVESYKQKKPAKKTFANEMEMVIDYVDATFGLMYPVKNIIIKG